VELQKLRVKWLACKKFQEKSSFSGVARQVFGYVTQALSPLGLVRKDALNEEVFEFYVQASFVSYK